MLHIGQMRIIRTWPWLGDRMELEQLYREMYPKLVAFFLAGTSSRETAEDLAQDVFYAALRGAGGFAGRASPAAWLFGIARNRLRRHYRAGRYKARLTGRLLDAVRHGRPTEEAGPEERAVRNELQQQLLDAIRRLEDREREVVLLRVFGELPFREIGELLGISENHARVIFHRIKLQLHKEMGDKPDGRQEVRFR